MNDLTIIYYTANIIPEAFAEKVRKQLLIAKGELPLISVSKKPMDFGTNICVGQTKTSHLNIYRQALIGAKEAKTRFIAMAEDDILYSPEHFTRRSSPGVFAYNFGVWNMYTWYIPPIFSWKGRRVLHSMICERDLFIEAMEERFEKYKDEDKYSNEFFVKYWAEPGKYEGKGLLDVIIRQTESFSTPVANIAFFHPTALSFRNGLGKRKKLGELRAIEIPYWGRAEEVYKYYV